MYSHIRSRNPKGYFHCALPLGKQNRGLDSAALTLDLQKCPWREKNSRQCVKNDPSQKSPNSLLCVAVSCAVFTPLAFEGNEMLNPFLPLSGDLIWIRFTAVCCFFPGLIEYRLLPPFMIIEGFCGRLSFKSFPKFGFFFGSFLHVSTACV